MFNHAYLLESLPFFLVAGGSLVLVLIYFTTRN